jgi:D-lactate dehydrogenase
MPLLEPDAKKIGRPAGSPYDDRVSDAVAEGTSPELREALVELLGQKQVHHRTIDLIRYATDASAYRLVPQAVVTPRTVDDVVAVLGFCRETGRHATFRAGGTSLNGQAQSDGILVDVRKHWYGMSLEDEGRALRARPGTILGHAATYLAQHGRRVGPDPASINAATIGGVVANNAAGMRCTLERNAYNTVRSLTFALPSGTVIDTAAADAEDVFAAAEPELAKGLMDLRAELVADGELSARIRHKFSIRCTNGYRLDALLDGETPLEIFRRLLVGSEGTLAFVAEVVIGTLPKPAKTSVTWIVVPSIVDAAALVPSIVALGAEAVELMMAPALTAAEESGDFPGAPAYFKSLDPNAAALLVEVGGDDTAALDDKEAKVRKAIGQTTLLHPLEFTRDAEAIEVDWRIREGLLGLVGERRPVGTSLITEDVCFPPARIADAARDLMALMNKHGFMPGVAGHAAYGNLHFTLTPRLDDPSDLKRYSGFMQDLVELVLGKYDGSLKAEHGTGRNMAPFLRHEWGEKATDMMWRIKQLADPDGVLSPDTLLTRNDSLYLQNLHSTPPIDDVAGATHCIECGYCEPVCPSRNVTTTPRQRIILRREMARQADGSRVLTQLLSEYEYDGIETCAADGSCQIPCPVGINTGLLIKAFRQRESTDAREKAALRIAKHYRGVEKLARTGLGASDIVSETVGVRALTELTAIARKAISTDLIPSVPGPMPQRAPAKLPATSKEGAAAVYFPACINRIFGRAPGTGKHLSLPEALVALSARAGKPLWIPDDVAGLCCSTPWASKGYMQGHQWMANAMVDALWRWSDGGQLPVVIDAASCTHGLIDDVGAHLDDERRRLFEKLSLHDAIEWTHQLMPSLTISRKLGSAAVHPTCSTIHLGLDQKLVEIAEAVATEVTVPIGTTCCGTAGDRGLLHPELVRSATRDEAASLEEHPADIYVSSNRTCEMGLLQATGKPYESFVFAVEELTRTPRSTPR